MTRHPMILQAPGIACDIVGDVHGQADALMALLEKSGWHIPAYEQDGNLPIEATHPEGRFLLLTGDLVNKGPDSLTVLRLVMGITRRGRGFCVLGNHDAMLLEALKSPEKDTKKCVRATARDIRRRGFIFTTQVIKFLESLPTQVRVKMPKSHPMAGDGWLTLVHAACPVKHLDRTTARAKQRNVFGFTQEEEKGHSPKRRFWGARYQGKRWVIHGHTPARGFKKTKHTLCLDAGAGENRNLIMFRLDGGEMLVQPIFLSSLLAMSKGITQRKSFKKRQTS